MHKPMRLLIFATCVFAALIVLSIWILAGTTGQTQTIIQTLVSGFLGLGLMKLLGIVQGYFTAQTAKEDLENTKSVHQLVNGGLKDRMKQAMREVLAEAQTPADAAAPPAPPPTPPPPTPQTKTDAKGP